jgi:hypothetical protein
MSTVFGYHFRRGIGTHKGVLYLFDEEEQKHQEIAQKNTEEGQGKHLQIIFSLPKREH